MNSHRLQSTDFVMVGGTTHWHYVTSISVCMSMISTICSTLIYQLTMLSRGLVDDYPCGLSVKRTSNVLMTCHDDNAIQEYSTSGSLVISIQLQVNHVTYPVHTVQLIGGQYVVSHQSHHGPEHGVSLIDKRGAVIATYKNNKTTKRMNAPRWIVVVNNYVLVTDVCNYRILLLNC